MIGREAWLRFWYLWAPAALVVVANAVWLGGVRQAVLGRGSLLEQQVDETKRAVAKLQSQTDELERSKGALASLEENLGALREEQMAPMRERLIPFLTDVVKRTHEAGLNPERVGYSARREEKWGLVYFSANYRIKGSYEQIRRCVFLLESSPQFLVLEGLALRGDESASSLEVEVQLGVGTYFSNADEKLMKELGVSEVTGGA